MTCSRCGRATDWDERLGVKPLCVSCFDKATYRTVIAATAKREYKTAWQRRKRAAQ